MKGREFPGHGANDLDCKGIMLRNIVIDLLAFWPNEAHPIDP